MKNIELSNKEIEKESGLTEDMEYIVVDLENCNIYFNDIKLPNEPHILYFHVKTVDE